MYQVVWQIPQQVLRLNLEGELSLEDFEQINRIIIEHMGRVIRSQAISLLIDVAQPCRPPKNFAQLKASQTYVTRHDLNYILVSSNDKFMRLVIMLTFNLCRPSLKFFEDVGQALNYWSSNSTNPLLSRK
jgi:hypothetical protein